MEQERSTFVDEGITTIVPGYMKEMLAELSQLARRSSGDLPALGRVGARHRLELREPGVERAEALAPHRRDDASSRASATCRAVVASTAGKIELESVGDVTEERVIERLVSRSVLNVFNRTFSLAEFDSLLAAFSRGATMHVSSTAAERRVREAGAADPRHEGRRREARRHPGIPRPSPPPSSSCSRDCT